MSVDDAHARIALYRWVKAGHLIALKKGVYMHRRFYERHRQEAAFSPVVSAILLPQSYLSLEYVLQQHGILTEITYPVTAITIKNTRTITNSLGTFVYRHIQPGLYQGFQIWKRTAFLMPRHRSPKPCSIISTCVRCLQIWTHSITTWPRSCA